MNFFILPILLTAIFQIVRSNSLSYDYSEEEDDMYSVGDKASHMCSETEEYEEKVAMPYNHTFTVSYTTWCLRNFLLHCTKFRNETKTLFKTISVLKTRTTVKCCQGFENVHGKCIAICHGVCVNGKCINPNECDCDLGWTGINCTEECEEGWFGKNCGLICNCNTVATCDRFNGTCHCQQGYTGIYCESTWPHKNSSAKLSQCKNGGNFSESDDICQCSPGYYGNFCEKPCEEGTFGENCSSNCSCDMEKTEMCSPVDGKCHCMPGWEGDTCDKPCDHGSWGWSCEHRCNCESNGTCHPVTGECFCPPGWHGLRCEKICPPGFYAQDCKMKCPECTHEPGICHHETGWCNCPPGVTGHLCDLECPNGRYGKNCTDFCLCNNNSTCDPVTGECSCAPGWRGKKCSLPCPDGTFGINCSFSCNCLNGATCNNINGICISEWTILEEISLTDLFSVENSYPSVGLQILLGIFLFILVALLVSFVWFKIIKTSYLLNMGQAFRSRLRRKQWFKTPEEEKEDTSVTNVCQEDSTSINQIGGQFLNPMYEVTKVPENSASRPTSTTHSNNWTNTTEQMKDEFDNLPFMIPEGSPIARPNVKISFGNEFPKCDTNPHPVINYSASGKTYFDQTERKSAFGSANVMNEHRYENIDGDIQAKNAKE